MLSRLGKYWDQNYQSKSSYRAEIDGLRAFAVLSVVTYHAFPSWINGGFIGVDIFFVISGFLITTHILECFHNGTFSFADFFGRRIRRIFPALLIILICSLVFGWFVLLGDEYSQLGKHIASGAAFVINFIFIDEISYFDNIAETKPMLHLWSLAIEEQFYILWPFILWVSWKFRFSLVTITLLVALMSFCYMLWSFQSNPAKTFFLPFSRFWELLSGSALACLFAQRKHSFSDSVGALTANIMSFSGLILLILGMSYINANLAFPSVWTLIPVVGSILVICAGGNAWGNRVILMNPISVWIGLISYPLYLWHWPILSFLRIIYGETPDVAARILGVIASVLLAWLTYAFIERPIRYGGSLRLKTLVLILFMICVGLAGWKVHVNKGQTPYNSTLNYISEARMDWDYPNGLVESKTIKNVYLTSKAPPQVIFFGDSHIEQYGPRLVDSYRKGASKEVAFITRGSCPPIPHVEGNNNQYCSQLIERLYNVLAENPIETIVIGASFNTYLSGVRHPDSLIGYYYDDGETRLSLDNAEGRALAKDSMYKFFSELAKNYKVTVMLSIPTDSKFSPESLLTSASIKRSIPLEKTLGQTTFKQAEYQIELSNELTERLNDLGITVTQQSSLICPNNICSAVTEDGIPIYKDSGHMRPFFVIDRMDVLDKFFIKEK